jgi:ribosome-associated protein
MMKTNSCKEFESEFEFFTSRSSGKGGQHVNKTDTKVELKFHIESSEKLTDAEKEILLKNLSNKINKDGYLQIVSQKFRSQIKNKKECIRKFYELIETGLHIPKERKKTKRSKRSIFKRLEQKRKQSEKKDRRKKDYF